MGILRSGNPAPLLSQNCIFGLSASQQNGRYSITSSARARSVGGISNTSALAVLRLIAKYKVVGAWTGKSAGGLPRRIRSR